MRLEVVGLILVSCAGESAAVPDAPVTPGSDGGCRLTDAGGVPACLPSDAGASWNDWWANNNIIFGADGVALVQPTTGSFMVLANESCATICAYGRLTARRISLQEVGGSRQWTLYLDVPGMPSDFIRVGDTLNLTVDASQAYDSFQAIPNQTVVLTRNGALIAFQSGRLDATRPQLDSYGITTAVLAGFCRTYSECAIDDVHALRVTTANGSIELMPGETAMIGTLSFSLRTLETLGEHCYFPNVDCSPPAAKTAMAGFITP